MAGFFAGTSAKYFSFPGDHFHLTVKGVIKISPHIQGKGMVEDAQFSKTSFNNQGRCKGYLVGDH